MPEEIGPEHGQGDAAPPGLKAPWVPPRLTRLDVFEGTLGGPSWPNPEDPNCRPTES